MRSTPECAPHRDFERSQRASKPGRTLSSVAGGNFTRLDYTWEYEGRPQDGSILIGYDDQREVVTAVWVDSWHMCDKAMLCEGHAGGGAVDLAGSYAAPPGPTGAGERSSSAPTAIRSRMTIFDVTSEGEEARAVEAE